MREYNEETNKELTFGNLPVPPEGVTLPKYMMMMMELTRENQTQVRSKYFSTLSGDLVTTKINGWAGLSSICRLGSVF